MKKTLIALAVLGLSGAAMAQSSVTLYGVADAGVGKINPTAQDGLFGSLGIGGAGPDSSNKKTQFISGSRMNNGDSRLGVRDVEDLGGGMKAGVNIETGLDLNSGGTLNYSGGGYWGRLANVWVSGDWGSVKLGRQYTGSYVGALVYELTGGANYSVLGSTYNYAEGMRVNSAFAYSAPTFNGLTVGGGCVSKNDVGLNACDAGAVYFTGPLKVAAVVSKTSETTATYEFGAKYDFDNFVLAASFTQASVPGTHLVRRGGELGGTAKFGAFSVTLDLTRDTKNEWVSRKYTNGLLELKYTLSKRTFVYAAYLRLDSTNNYSLGINHSF